MALLGHANSPVSAEEPRLSFSDRILSLRDRLLANSGFQQLAGTFPFTRPVARRRAKALFDLCAGFVYSQILLACVKLRLFEHLAEGPQSVEQLASKITLPVDSARMLLDGAASLKLVQRRSANRYGLGPLGAALLGNRGVAAMVEHHAMLYGDLSDPVAVLRGRGGGELARYWPYANAEKPDELDADSIGSYTALMSASQPMIAREVIRAYSFRNHRCLLDIGGGDGAFLSAVAADAPELRMVLFDLPAVADKASARFRTSGLSARAVAVGGNFFKDRLPEGADAISLVRIVHDHDDENVLALLRNIRRVIAADGTLILAEPLSGESANEAIGDAYFAFYLRAMGSGRPRTFAQIKQMLGESGFFDVRLLPTGMPILTRVVTAKPDEKYVNLA